MADPAYSLWSSLTDDERVERMMEVIREAGLSPSFRSACLDEKTRKDTIEKKAQVTFDTVTEIRCYPDKSAAESEIVLRLPAIALPVDAKVEDYWLCTYVDYRTP
jgi:hypothetical protein